LAELDGKNPFKDVDPKSAVAPYYWAFYKANIVRVILMGHCVQLVI